MQELRKTTSKSVTIEGVEKHIMKFFSTAATVKQEAVVLPKNNKLDFIKNRRELL